ncbi:MAG TPA: HNH endonuclease, partial [Euzebya sp.]|nr:HNH endonuclease [Euzebya sp.]
MRHHVIPREQQGPTEVLNLVAMCRACHTRIRLHRWQMDLHAGTLLTRVGRHTYLTRPRLPGASGTNRTNSLTLPDSPALRP